MDEVTHELDEELSDVSRSAIRDLMTRVFFPEGTRIIRGPKVVDGRELAAPAERIETPNGRVYLRPARLALTPQPQLMHFTVWEGGIARAHAMTFARRVQTEAGAIDVIALAGVCVEASLQGRGLGAKVVRAALADQVPEGGCALFQTGVPGFYETLGCRRVDNHFVDRRTALDPEATAFWDRHAMVYPASYPWPEGVVDLCGSGF